MIKLTNRPFCKDYRGALLPTLNLTVSDNFKVPQSTVRAILKYGMILVCRKASLLKTNNTNIVAILKKKYLVCNTI